MIGGFGEAEVLSFQSDQFLNASAGGAVVTQNVLLAEQLRRMRNFGCNAAGEVVGLGMDGGMSDASAALGLRALESMHTFTELNRRNFAHYDLRLTNLPGVVLVTDESLEQRNFHHVVVEVDESIAGLSRDELMAVLRAENIVVGGDHLCSHLAAPYQMRYSESRLRLAHSELLAERILILPSGSSVNEVMIEAVCDVIRTAVRHAGVVKAKLCE
jgi:dTDP-4-amino-4,6-dideoxygalactose transaminase